MTYDAVIVGGGIIGCTHAYYLSQRGLKVAVVEKDIIGGGTTSRNFGWVNGTSKTSDESYHRLNALGVQMYEQLATEFGSTLIGLNPTGALGLVPASDPDGKRLAHKHLETLTEFGYPCRWIDAAELALLEPNLTFPADTGAVLSPTDKCLDAQAFARFMAEQVRTLGGTVMEHCAALELLADDDGKVTGVRTELGDLATPRLVVTTGPNTPEVLATLTGYEAFATRFPIGKVPGLLVTTPPVAAGLVRHLVYMDSPGEFHFFPDFNGGLRIGSDLADGQIIDDQSPENLRRLALGLLRQMQVFAPDFAGEACIDDCTLSVGIRAYPEDGHSIAGAMPGAEGLYLIATHSGVTLAPILGKLMADLVLSGTIPDALAPFGLDRLSGFG